MGSPDVVTGTNVSRWVEKPTASTCDSSSGGSCRQAATVDVHHDSDLVPPIPGAGARRPRGDRPIAIGPSSDQRAAFVALVPRSIVRIRISTSFAADVILGRAAGQHVERALEHLPEAVGDAARPPARRERPFDDERRWMPGASITARSSGGIRRFNSSASASTVAARSTAERSSTPISRRYRPSRMSSSAGAGSRQDAEALVGEPAEVRRRDDHGRTLEAVVVVDCSPHVEDGRRVDQHLADRVARFGVERVVQPGGDHRWRSAARTSQLANRAESVVSSRSCAPSAGAAGSRRGRRARAPHVPRGWTR